MLSRLGSLFVLSLLATVLSLPASVSAETKVDDAYSAAVSKLLVVQKTPEAVAAQVSFSVAQQTLGSLAANGIAITEPMQKIVFDQARETFGARFGDVETLTKLYVPIYAENYSMEELLELIAFWESPIGKKTIDLMPGMTEASYAVLDKASTEHLAEFHAEVDKRLAEAGIELAPR